MHTRFSKALLITCCCLLTVTAFTQTSADSIFTGFCQFRLGDPQSKFGGDLIFIPGADTTNPKHAPYGFGYKGVKPAATNPEIVPFKNFVVYFDTSKALVRIDFINVYGGKILPSLRQGRKAYQLLLTWFTEKLKQPGKKVTYYKNDNYIHEGYEWEQGNTTLALDLQYRHALKTGSLGVNLAKK
jgi:hypothetical protein